MPRIENWSIVSNEINPFQAPECQVIRLQGNIFDDELKRFKDNTSITTSKIKSIDLKNNQAQTKNTLYDLGKPSEDYIKWLSDNNMTLEQFVK